MGDDLKSGVYGWRKRCLYLAVAVLTATLTINIALTVWILRVLDFSVSGMGRLRVTSQGLRLEGRAEVLQQLAAAEISSRKESPLKIQSAKNITLQVRDKTGEATTRLTLGPAGLEVWTDTFSVRGTEGQSVFRAAAGMEVDIGTPSLRISGEGGMTFEGSVQTPLVRSEPYQQLRLESPTKKVRILGPEGVGLESRAGDISAICLDELRLQSREGSIVLDSEKVELKKLPEATDGPQAVEALQLCVCPTGRLFTAPASALCATDALCRQ